MLLAGNEISYTMLMMHIQMIRESPLPLYTHPISVSTQETVEIYIYIICPHMCQQELCRLADWLDGWLVGWLFGELIGYMGFK